MVGKLLYYLLSFDDTCYKDKFIQYLGVEFDIFLGEGVYDNVCDLIGVF